MYRPVIMGKNGMVAASHTLASLAGLKILQEGGNAFDAAIAASAVMGVVHPHESGIGGDIFFLLYSSENNQVQFLNGSGRAPQEAGIDTLAGRGFERLPRRGVVPVTVPGCVSAWGEVWKRYGSLPLSRLLQPAVHYARNGFPAGYGLIPYLSAYQKILWQDQELRRLFFTHDRLIRAGEVIRQEQLANTLEIIGHDGPEVFYHGQAARKIEQYMAKKNGFLNQRDLMQHASTWAEPIAVKYGDNTIYQTPPNTQGLSTLMAFNIMEGLEPASYSIDTPEFIHILVETKKIACKYREQYITDPEFIPVEYGDFLDKPLAARLRKMIELSKASEDDSKAILGGCSSYLACADRDGNVASAVQSLGSPWGAGFCMGELGIILQNRGAWFSLDPSHINRLEPGKRTFHTLSATLITSGGHPAAAFGSTGDDGQLQVHLQVLTRILHSGANIQEAVEMPRWIHGAIYPGDNAGYLNMEGRFSMEVVGALETWGHNIRMIDDWALETGEAQGIIINRETGVFSGCGDPRGDGYAAAY